MDALVQDGCGALLGEHGVEEGGLEDLLEGVEGEAGELALDEVWAVLHDRLEFYVAICALPTRNQVEHVHTIRCFPLTLAGGTSEFHREDGEEGGPCGLVAHLDKSAIEVHFRSERADGKESSVAYDQQRCYSLVKKPRDDLSSLLQYYQLTPCALGCAHLYEETQRGERGNQLHIAGVGYSGLHREFFSL